MGAPLATTLVDYDQRPFGDGYHRTKPDMAHAMVAALAAAEFASAADALKHLRQSFPQAPLGTRVAAANLLMERQQRTSQA